MTNLSILDLSHNCLLENVFRTFFKGKLPSLTSLKLNDNKFSQIPSDVLYLCPNVQKLFLSKNNIRVVTNDLGTVLSDLRLLDLSFNHLVVILPNLQQAFPLMEVLNISGNSVTEIPRSFVNSSSSLLSFNAGGNPFSCSCNSANNDFQTWISTDTRTRLDFELDQYYTCVTPEEFDGKVITDPQIWQCVFPSPTSPDVSMNVSITPSQPFVTVTPFKASYTYLQTIVAGVVGLLCLLILVWSCYKYRWHLRYKKFKFCHRVYLQNDIEDYIDNNAYVDEDAANNIPIYDAFVAYEERDENWVFNELIPNVEVGANAMRLYIGIRDDELGQYRVEAVIDGIERSKKTLIVLSPHFMESEWCYFEMQIAQHRLLDEGRDVIVPILLQPIPDDKMTRLLRKLLRIKGVLEYTEDPVGKELFWQKLKLLKLKRPVRINRRFQL